MDMGDNDHHTLNGIHGIPSKRRGKNKKQINREITHLGTYNSFSKG